MHPLGEIINQVREFAEATKEVIVLDIHRLVEGFDKSDGLEPHRILMAMIKEKIGHLISPIQGTRESTLHEIWEAGENKRNIKIGYVDLKKTYETTKELYTSPWLHKWGDVDTVDNLRDFLNESIQFETDNRFDFCNFT